MEKAKVIFSDNQKERKIPTGIRMLLRRCCNAVLIMEDFEGSAEVDISFVDDKQMHEINFKHRGVDSSTDVLSPSGKTGCTTKTPKPEQSFWATLLYLFREPMLRPRNTAIPSVGRWHI